MRGRITQYFSQEEFGFIQDELGGCRLFKASDVLTAGEIEGGETVEFKAVDEDGLTAKQIKVRAKRPFIISLGDIKIRLRDIKEYYLTTEYIDQQTANVNIDTQEEKVAGAHFSLLTDHGNNLPEILEVCSHDDPAISQKVWTEYSVLCIITYSGEEYRFSQWVEDFDVVEKFKELDEIFVVT